MAPGTTKAEAFFLTNLCREFDLSDKREREMENQIYEWATLFFNFKNYLKPLENNFSYKNAPFSVRETTAEC